MAEFEESERDHRVRELTEHLERERERLRQSEEYYRLFTEGVKDYAILALDSSGCITHWNDGARRLLGYTEEEAIGRPIAITFTAKDRAAGKPEHELKQARRHGSAENENWAVRKDGSQFWASGVTQGVADAMGSFHGFVKIFRDLTARRQAEETLRQSEERLHIALQAAHMGTWLWDIPTRRGTVDENLRRLLGLSPNQTIDQLTDFLAVVHPDDRAAATMVFDRSLREGVDLRFEFRVVWPDNTVHWLYDQGDVVRDSLGQPLYLTGACVDITERKAMEAELRQARDELEQRVQERTAELQQAQRRALQAERLATIGQTVAGLAHEGRNALQVIHACTERLRWRLEVQYELLGIVDEIQHAQETLRRLFEDVGSYAAPIRLQRQFCNVAELWRACWTQATARHARKEARLEELASEGELTLEADPFRLGQVFSNIFDNSLAACPDPVVVVIACERDETIGQPAIRVTLRDNGPGLNAEQQQNIFTPFYTTKVKGMGLGMAIAQRIVEAHGGQIQVGLASPGMEIIIVLPRREI